MSMQPHSPSNPAVGRLAILACLAQLVACAQQPAVRGAWEPGADRGKPFARVLVVGVSPDVRQRCAFERYLAAQIESAATAAFTSCDTLGKDKREPLSRASIEEAVATQQADAVVATVLVSSKVGAETGGERDTRGTAAYKATGAGWDDGYYGMYGVPVIYGEFVAADASTTLQADVTVASRVFATQGPTLVYTMQTGVKNIESRDEGFSAVTGPIADRLRRDGLIR